MPLPDSAPLETLSLAELREVVGTLLAKVAELVSANAALKAGNQALRDEVARLKGLPPRPPSRPSGMEKATGGAGPGKSGERSRRRRGAKRDRDAVTAEVVVKAAPPPGSRFKGYQDILVRELTIAAEVVRYRRERWATPSGETVLAPLPAGVVGGFGPGLRRFLLVAHAQGQVTTERLVALLAGIGIEISKRQVVRLLTSRLDGLIAEERDVLRTGLATARWVTVDDTAARHARQDGVTTQIGDERFTAFRTGASKSRQAILSLLRAGHGEYMINDAALAYMRGRALAGPVIEQLAGHPTKVFADEAAWTAHLAALGIDRLAVTPEPVRIATEGALWGTIQAHALLPGTVIVSDDAGQFRLGEHALCWVHAERLGGVRAHLHPPHRLRRARSAAGPAALAEGRTAARPGATRDPAAHQRLRERHPCLRHQAQGLRRHHERGRPDRPRRAARPDEDLPQARSRVLPPPR